MDNISDRLIDDISIKGMLHCVAVRSRIRKGRVRSFSLPPLPDQVFFIRAADIPGRNSVTISGVEIPVLVTDEIRYQGEALALLCGPDEQELAAIAALVETEYERNDPLELSIDTPDDLIVTSRVLSMGDPPAGFEEAFQVIEGEYQMDSGTIAILQPVGALAEVGENGISVATSTGWLHHVRYTVAQVLDSPAAQIEVSNTAVAGSGPGCIWYPSLLAAQAAVAAASIGHPVRMVLSSQERNAFTTRKPGSIIRLKTGLRKDGTISAMEIDFAAEGGAYPTYAREHLDRLLLSVAGHYSAKNIKISGKLVYTSLPPIDMRGGLGLNDGFFALEVHTTRLAELSHEDPAEWRCRVLLSERKNTITRVRAGKTPQKSLIEAVVKDSDFSRKYSANEMLRKRRGSLTLESGYFRGIGIATAFQGGGFINSGEQEPASVTAHMDSESKLNISTSATFAADSGRVLFRDTASRILGLDPADVTLNASIAP
ncbi:MAG: molybdopterin-dependent oxidoreductase, partial [Spirochaetales bacterium]|nr:molybdopterin-dependent oxidoreductase [Spirochaetales bacterium]